MFLLLTANILVMLYIYFMKRTFFYMRDMEPRDEVISCIFNNSTLTILMLKSHQLVGPTFVEYTLLSITIFLEIWSPTQVEHSDDTSRQIEVDGFYTGSHDRHVEDRLSLERQIDDADGGSRDIHVEDDRLSRVRQIDDADGGSRDIHVGDDRLSRERQIYDADGGSRETHVEDDRLSCDIQIDDADGGSRDIYVEDARLSRDIHIDAANGRSRDRRIHDQHETEQTLSVDNVCERNHGRQIQHDDDNGFSERGRPVNCNHQDSELIPLLHSIDGLDRSVSRSRRRWKVSHIATLAISLTAGLGLIICYIAQAMDIGNLEQLHSVTELYELTIIVIMVSVQLVGFFCLSHHCVPKKSVKPLRPRDYVYLLSAFGLITFHFYETLGGDTSSGSSSGILLYKSIISILQDYLQVVFLLQANRCQKSRPSVPLLESVLICTMIMNVIAWFNNSFLMSEFPSTRDLEHSGFPKHVLHFIYDVLLPVAVFFRFTSFLEYYATFEEYNS
ncbi:uncharacterized protein [Argopecten irradians]|uniref:uncharacterized protein n=1 Tax=Argopecten irradians TaxID=31199 RepID=UPI00371AA420